MKHQHSMASVTKVAEAASKSTAVHAIPDEDRGVFLSGSCQDLERDSLEPIAEHIESGDNMNN